MKSKKSKGKPKQKAKSTGGSSSSSKMRSERKIIIKHGFGEIVELTNANDFMTSDMQVYGDSLIACDIHPMSPGCS